MPHPEYFQNHHYWGIVSFLSDGTNGLHPQNHRGRRSGRFGRRSDDSKRGFFSRLKVWSSPLGISSCYGGLERPPVKGSHS